MAEEIEYTFHPFGMVRSVLKDRADAPAFGEKGAPEAWLELEPDFAQGLHGIEAGAELIVLTWLHLARRDRLKIHPRGDPGRPLTGVFATRSPVRPNPVGLHRVTVLEITGSNMKVTRWRRSGTPVIDPKLIVRAQREACNRLRYAAALGSILR